MQYRDEARIDTTEVRRGGGSGRGGGGRRSGGRLAVGGGAGGVVVLVLVLLFGDNLGISVDDLMGSGQNQPQGQNQQSAQDAIQCEDGADIQSNPECRWDAYASATELYWQSAMGDYESAPLTIFSGQVSTACGTGSSEMGPFYCPADAGVYLDTQFTEKLLANLGAQGGDAAEAYVVAHEYGHHVSNITGQMAQSRAAGNDSGPTSNQVRLELQADCYAGVFFANTINDPASPIEEVTRDDLARVADAASAVGDDHIQEQGNGRVVPESWTHGSSEMRQRWVAKGFDSGDPSVCDTFATDDL
ncbi:MAG: KPN_02809 family neutral zinc metallopeptidase [Arachnia sp.]